MNKFFLKNESLICIGIIASYLITNSIFLDKFGMYNWQTMLLNIFLSILIIGIIKVFKLKDYFNLTKLPNFRMFLYFIPLTVLMSINLWGGIYTDKPWNEVIFYMISMIFVGFLEEIIFRGFLFKLLAKDNIYHAIIITSLTFGIGHIINLFMGADLFTTIIQIIYATATGYLFATIVVKGKSLWPSIITHSVVNALSVFTISTSFTKIFSPICLTLIPIVYAVYLNKMIKAVK